MGASQRYADNVTQLLIAQANAQAEAQRANGQLWGQTLANLGQTVASIPAQREQQQLVNLQLQEGQAKLAALKQSQAAQQRANQIIGGLSKNPDGTYPADQVLQQLGASNLPLEQQKQTLDLIEGMNKTILSAQESKQGHLADVANLLLSSHPKDQPVDPGTLHLTFAALKQAGLVNDQDEQGFTAMMAGQTDGRDLLTNIRRSSKKYQELDKAAQEQQKLTAETAKATAEATKEQQVAANMQGGLTPDQLADNARQATRDAQTAKNEAEMRQIARGNLGVAQAREMREAKAAALQDAGAGAAVPPNPNLKPGEKDDAFLQGLPTAQAAQVKALAEGRMQFPSGFALRSPYWQGMLQAVARYDPSFDAVNYNARAKTRADFTSGKSAAQANAINTVIGHLSDLSDAADALHNGNIQLFNRVANAVSKATGSPAVTNFDTIKKAVSDEVTRVWRQAGGSEADVKAAQANLDSAGSPAQLHEAIATYGHLLESKLGALNEQYRQGMGTDKIDILTPKSRTTLDKLERRAGGKPASAPAAGSSQKIGRFEVVGVQ